MILRCKDASLNYLLNDCTFSKNNAQDKKHMTDITQYPDTSVLEALL